MIEFGFVLGQMNDVRHGTREAARLSASNAGSAPAMRAVVCGAMDLSGGQTVSFTDSAGGAVGDEVVLTVSVPVQSITGVGFITTLLPPSLSTTARARL